MDQIKRLLKPVFRVTYQPLMRLMRGQTLGVRCAVIDDDDRLLLVRHSYSPGWTFPGGGVEHQETLLEALRRELREEAGIALQSPPRLHGIFANRREFPGDHVAFYVARDWQVSGTRTHRLEIVEQAFFNAGALPETITGSARRRVDELFGHAALSEEW